MTNRISSAEQATDALMRVRSKSARVHVRFACQRASFTFSGFIGQVGKASLEILGHSTIDDNAEELLEAPKLVLSLLGAIFLGEISESNDRLSLDLAISRKGGVERDGVLYRADIISEWKRSSTSKECRPM